MPVDRALGERQVSLGQFAVSFEFVGLQVLLPVLGIAESENGARARTIEHDQAIPARPTLPGPRHPLLDDTTAKIGVDLAALGALGDVADDRVGQAFLATKRANHLVIKMRNAVFSPRAIY